MLNIVLIFKIAGMEVAFRDRQELIAGRLHNVFAYTALPTGCVLGLFLFGLAVQAHMEAHIVGRAIAIYCAVVSCVMTGLLVYLHLSTYSQPTQQRLIIRILLMVPIYAVDSCLALWNYQHAPLVGLVRDAYEAYVIYNFFHLLMNYLGGEQKALSAKIGSQVKHMFPLCCLPDFPLTHKTMIFWKLCLLQYLVLKPLIAVITLILSVTGHYDEASWSFGGAYVYFVFVLNFSVTLAFTCLVYFFKEFRTQLEWVSPLGKFAAVKAVVFLSFWQGVIAGLLVHWNVIQGSKEGLWTKDEVATGVQDFLICVEMLAMCYVHHLVFPETPYITDTGYQRVKLNTFLHVISVRDIGRNFNQALSDFRDDTV